MLTLAEKIVFALLVLLSLTLTGRGVWRMVQIIRRGQGRPNWQRVLRRAGVGLLNFVSFRTVLRTRLLPSLIHAVIGWAFIYFILVNLGDLLFAYIPGFVMLGEGLPGAIHRLLADLLGTAIVFGALFFAIRRFGFRPANLTARESSHLSPQARAGIERDSAIVAGFIILHLGARLVGESFLLGAERTPDSWQPVASTVSRLWVGVDPAALLIGWHVCFWLSLGLILAFLPYFPYSKHIHLFMAPLNFMFKPERKSIGEQSYLNLDDEKLEQFGATRLEHLGYEQLMDGYACVMCFRCQDACPAYATGKMLSPAALEINKRYAFNTLDNSFAAGGEGPVLLNMIPAEAVWACTSCGACVDICPVGNEPMRDILDIRRSLAMMESQFPKPLESALKGMERNANPWNISQNERMKWAGAVEGGVPTVEQNPEPDLLWWVGCAPATDPRAQKTAQAFAKILNAAGVNYAVLGKNEACTGDSARRAGREDIFFGLAQQNVEILNEVAPKRIVTTCPHCLHTLKNEYPAFGGNYQVIHHTQLINELVGAGKIRLETSKDELKITFHDPCYLGRHNNTYDAPRQALQSAGVLTVEMPRHAAQSFCCGAGGAQMWKEDEPGQQRINTARYEQARASGARAIATGCPFCLSMLTDASKKDGDLLPVRDVAEMVADRLK